MKKVLVTGANGHLGNNVVRLLADSGYTVRASVRNLGDPRKTEPLEALSAELVEADIMKPETLETAVDGVDGVFHVAAAYLVWSKNPQRDIIDPSVKGAINMLEAAHKAGVERVVMTSSCAAVGQDATAENPLTEEDWNDEAVNPYGYAKTEAERRAWAFAEDTGLDLVVINPSGILGPGFYRHTPTTAVFEMLLRQKLPVILPLGFSYVDVRDVAKAHLLAFENAKASGRYIASDQFLSLRDLVLLIKELEPDLKVPTKLAGPILLRILPAVDWLQSKLTRQPRQMTRSLLKEFASKEQHVSNEKLRTDLGWEPMDFRESLRETIDWTRSHFIDK